MKIVDLLLQHNLDYSYESGKFIKSIIFNNNYIIDFDNRPLTNLKFLTGLFEEIDLNNIKFVNVNIQTICVLSDLYRNRKNNILNDEKEKIIKDLDKKLKSANNLLKSNGLGNSLDIDRLNKLIDKMNNIK